MRELIEDILALIGTLAFAACVVVALWFAS